MGRSCFNIISCGCINQSVDKDEVDVSSQIKGPHKSGWSLKKTSPKREAPSNTVVNENLSSTDNKEIREPINISSEPHINSNISEKTLDNILTKDIPNLATKVVCEENDIKCERISEESESKSKSESAVLVIQAAVRRFLAERQLVRHKNAVKLQAAVRGHLVRNHAVGTLRCVQAIVKMQTLVRARREKGVQNMGSVNSNPTHVSVEKLLSNGLARQLLESTPKTKQINIKCDPLKSDSAWNWLERWMSVSAPETLQPHTDKDNVVNKTEDEVKTVISKTIPENSLSNTEPKLITENPVSENEDKLIPENLVLETKPEPVPENLVSETELEPVPQNPVSETEPKPIPENPTSKTEPELVPENPISETEPEPVHENLISETEPKPVSENPVSETGAKPIPENPILGTEPKQIPENPKSETEPEPTPGNSISDIEPEPIPENPVSETKPEPMPENPISETEPEPIPENPVSETKPEPMPENPISETEPEPIPENPVSETKPEPMPANPDSEPEPEPMPENAVSETEAKHASKQTGSRKASNPAFIAAQSKFEKLTSFKVNPLKSPGSSDQDDEPGSGSGSILDIGSSDPLKPANSSDLVDVAGSGSVGQCDYSVSPGSQVAQTGGSECGTELSITSTLHSSGPFEIENTKFEKADTNINCDDYNNNNNSNDNNSNNSRDNNNNNNNNNIGVAPPEKQVDQNPDNIEPEPEPESSHITNLESQETPSSQLSTASKKTRTYKKVSGETRKSWSNSKKTSPVSSSVEQLPKESKPGKRRNLFGSPKPDHVDGEPVIPGYLQPTESARAKVVANSSPRSSPDLKKRQSLPGAINGRHGSPRIQRSMSQATKGDGNQDGK